MSHFHSKAFDYNDLIKQIRGFVQGHPQVLKSNDRQAQSGITTTGTGAGELYVSTESYTPAGAPGSPLNSPGPGTLYRLTCTVAGSNITSPKAQFDVEQVEGVSPGFLGTLLAGDRWKPDLDVPYINSPQLTSPVVNPSPFIEHGLQLILTTSTAWVVSDTIEFRLVDHNIGRNVDDNFQERLYTEEIPDVNGDFVTEWYYRFPTIAHAGESPEFDAHGGMQSSYNNPDSRFNVAVTCSSGFESSNLWGAQPGNGGARYGYFTNLPMTFWLTCDADGFYVVVKVGSVYEHMTVQFMEVFANGNQHPLPLFFGAMGELNDSTALPSQTDNSKHAAWWDPAREASARFRWVDGTWYDIINRDNTQYVKNSAVTGWIQPWKTYDQVSTHDSGTIPSFSSGTSNNYSWDRLSYDMIARYDGSYELLPATLFISTPQSACIGNLKFIKYVSGTGVNSEDTTTDTAESPQKEYIAFQNAQLQEPDSFCLMELVE